MLCADYDEVRVDLIGSGEHLLGGVAVHDDLFVARDRTHLQVGPDAELVLNVRESCGHTLGRFLLHSTGAMP